ncbi:MAG TPA: beta-L-arabinofuranosidase domain-containing protein [Trebonia sp.]|nr:beta-L-arabinofuranosidase domain-containing protein [Trebonia sp.]
MSSLADDISPDGAAAGLSAGDPAPAGPVGMSGAADWAHRPLPGRGARLTRGLLHDWQRRNLAESLPIALRQLEAAGNLDNIRLAIRSGAGGMAAGDGGGPRYRGPVFMDSDIYKTLEAIGWELGRGSRPELAAFAAQVTGLLERAQLPDGYLDSYFQVTGEPRYSRLASSHEMYCAGHLIQAAIALRRGAGDGRLLAVAVRLADHLVREFLGAARGLDGHPVIETALVELYRETGNRDYLALAGQFVDQRGAGLAGDSGMGRRYLQDHVPVRSSRTEVGHVVRALYLEAGVADVAAESGDRELLESSVRRWADMVAAKTYLTGGNGSRHCDEGFGDRFELPPDRAYNETCAAIASFHWSWRLLLATGDARYADHMERVLYNGFAAAVSADGRRFFYVNPLQRREDHFEKDDPGRRHEWFSCACCPPNIMRLIASLGHYIATTSDDTLYLHQFTGSRLSGAGLDVEVATGYPWSGQVDITVLAAASGERGLGVRVPAWSAGPRFRLNDEAERAVVPVQGYLLLRREWRPGDRVRLLLDMAPRFSYPDRRVDAVRGCVAVERGPLVYCFEQADQPPGARVDDLLLDAGGPLDEFPVTLDGVGQTIQVRVRALRLPPDDPRGDAPAAGTAAVGVPYFQWDNRDGGAMRVWMPCVQPAVPRRRDARRHDAAGRPSLPGTAAVRYRRGRG